ncbi:2-C-methyl-D-erythritol 4-phosphate cytidylyltransferase [Mycobacterium sp. SMC-4]|uniref:IspD/TarI family cytidylyltransferase n=1 Tax=Mycobacterium sp. SMC-4 TaxID=2857059 RepID=UPI0021B32BA9|nr:IspD/TarI family cytidylyltransferase [Mycobacterium sp. SMC-4]UXA16534.1 2-C-methyl-D-erythritol 4-phosphate cytidylyltransferase [Mycobacterium sp. SMC-4]
MGIAVAVVLAAGLGTRVGADGNKAYLPLAGRSMLVWSLETISRTPSVDRTVLVFRRGERDLAEQTIQGELPDLSIDLVEGGQTRHGSEFNVLSALAAEIDRGDVDVVAIHDAARPLADPAMFESAIALARRHGGALPALPLTDVAHISARGLEPADGALVRVQTPQAFRAGDLLHAYRCAARDGFEGTDTSSCVEHYTDLDVRTFPGRSDNLKVTYAGDIAVAQRLLTDRPMAPR